MNDTERSPTDPVYLQSTYFIDSDHPDVVAFTRRVTDGASDDVDRAVRLFYAVRDGIRYDPYTAGSSPDGPPRKRVALTAMSTLTTSVENAAMDTPDCGSSRPVQPVRAAGTVARID